MKMKGACPTSTRFGLNLITVSCVLLVHSVFATQRSAFLRVENQLGTDIVGGSLTVVHKYSNVYKDMYTFPDALASGQTTKDNLVQPYTVQYNTGEWTTGVDWWFITWVADGTLYKSSPQNGQCSVNSVEAVMPAVAAGSAGIAAFIMTCLSPPVAGCTAGGVLATAASTAVSGYLSTALFNSESTCGFKRCYLTQNDENKPVTITLSPGNVKIRPAISSNCDTGYETVVLPRADVQDYVEQQLAFKPSSTIARTCANAGSGSCGNLGGNRKACCLPYGLDQSVCLGTSALGGVANCDVPGYCCQVPPVCTSDSAGPGSCGFYNGKQTCCLQHGNATSVCFSSTSLAPQTASCNTQGDCCRLPLNCASSGPGSCGLLGKNQTCCLPYGNDMSVCIDAPDLGGVASCSTPGYCCRLPVG